jgi:hypothetical protein
MNNDFHASNGEVVRRRDLERAAGTGSFTQADESVATCRGIDLARAALAGDQAALDKFHDQAGIALSGVTEDAEGEAVRLLLGECAVFAVTTKAGEVCAVIDAAELVAWIYSSEGQAALKHRGVALGSLATTRASKSAPSSNACRGCGDEIPNGRTVCGALECGGGALPR